MRVYLSHAIRGAKGEACTREQQKKNCDNALAFAEEIRKACPWIDLYVPAEHEEFVQIAYDKKYLTVDQILEVDFEIIRGCQAVLVYAPNGEEIQGGRKAELDFALGKEMWVHAAEDSADAVEWVTYVYDYADSDDYFGEH